MTIVEAASGKVPEAGLRPGRRLHRARHQLVLDAGRAASRRRSSTSASGTDAASYEGVDVKGAVVLGDGSHARVWTQAVQPARRHRRHLGRARPRLHPARLSRRRSSNGAACRTTTPSKAFGFNGQPQGGRAAQGAAARRSGHGEDDRRDPVPARDRRGGYLVAEIPGRVAPEQRVVLVAHVQEPGANDNASGCGTLYETGADARTRPSPRAPSRRRRAPSRSSGATRCASAASGCAPTPRARRTCAT